ncbi:MAG: hypothetical protein AB1489_29720 [Acidobacteriota bacterium]
MDSPVTNLEDLVRAVASVSPQLADAWETTAIIESLGYTDGRIADELGFANALALGQYIYKRLSAEVPTTPTSLPVPLRWEQRMLAELRCFIEQFSRSFIYALPWIATFLFEYAQPQHTTLVLPPELAAPLSLAVMASLITSGGFIQVIARRGLFYINLGEEALSRRVCAQFLRLGLATTILIGFIGLLFGFYRALFADEHLIAAAIYYLILSLLWMICAVLSIQKHAWRIPVVFLSGGVGFIILRAGLDLSALMAQLGAALLTLALAILLAILGFRTVPRGNRALSDDMEMPRLPALFYSLIPYFVYGTAYFSFLFADRLMAGVAVNPVTGLSFAVDAQYKRGMDLALLNFLLIAAIAEYLNYQFMHYWYNRATHTITADTTTLARQLRHRYFLFVMIIIILFTLCAVVLAYQLGVWQQTIANAAARTALIGSLGYLMLSVGLFNAMVLFSLSRPIPTLVALLPALMLNLMVGYSLSHMFGVHNAAVGLALGAAVFVLLSGRSVLQALQRPDYAYYAA